MDTRLKDTYRRFPITATFGYGVYSYTLFCIDNNTSTQVRYEVRANTLDEARIYANDYLNTGSSYNILDDTSLEVYFTMYPSYFSYLFI